jgi:Holliday junction resolvase
MSTKSKRRGTAAETAVVRYLRNWWPAAERRALSGALDRGDVAGIPGVCIEVKAAQRLELAAWKRETLVEQENAGARFSMLVVKRFRKPVAEWDAYMPRAQFEDDFFEGMTPWIRVDLQVAAALLRSLGCWPPSSNTTE